MSLEDIRSECSDIAALLQPYVDGELADDEGEKVAEHLHRCSGCRAAVSEQAWVRATLQSVSRERAPQAVRARILQGLDEIDREASAASPTRATAAPPGLGSRMWQRLRELGRGGLIMVPAGAVAVGLFFVARQGGPPPVDADAQHANMTVNIGSAMLPGAKKKADEVEAEAEAVSPVADASDDQRVVDEKLLAHVRSLEPSVGFSVQLPSRADRRTSGTARIQLVNATVDDAQPSEVQLRYAISDRGQAQREGYVVDRQRTADALESPGQPMSIGGRRYWLYRDAAGQPMVLFEHGGVRHLVRFESPVHDTPDLGVGPALPDGTSPDFAPVLRVAEHLRAMSR